MHPKIFEAKLVKREAISSQITSKLRQDIFTGKYKPGDRLAPERELAERYGISRITVRQALQDEQVLAREMILEVEHPEFGTVREVASPIKTEGAVTAPARAPRLGEHTDAILSEVLGYGNPTIAALRSKGAIG